MHRLHGWTDEDTAAAEKLLIDAVAHALAVVCNQMADMLGAVTVAAAAKEPTPEQIAKAMVDAAAAGPPGQPYVSVDDLGAMPGLWTGQMQDLIMPLEGQIYRDAAGKLHAELVDLVGPSVPSIGSQAAEEFLAQAANRWDFVGDDVWSTARAQLVEGFAQGESIPKLAARVRSAAVLSARNATAVARTEVVAASNAGSFATAQLSQLDMVKVWLATEDERTRPTHNAADGQKQPLAQPFEVGLSSLAFPGDPGGAPQEVKNCRCTVTYEIPDAAVKQARVQPATQSSPPSVAGPVQPSAGAAEQAARVRQADIDEARKVATAAAEVDELIANEASTAALRSRISATADRVGVPDDVRDEWLAAVEAEDVGRLAAAADEAAARAGLTPIGKAGDIVAFDRKLHQAVDEVPRVGQAVEVVRRGYSLRRGDEDIQLSKAKVDLTDEPLPVKPPVAAEVRAAETFADRQNAMAELSDIAPVEVRQLGGGFSATTELVTYGGGRTAVRKVYGTRVAGSKAEIKKQIDSEVLGSAILDAAGVRAPATVVTSPGHLLMEHIDDGVTWAESNLMQEIPSAILESVDGRRIGLADMLMLNTDRNEGNWMRLPDGHLAGIDHGHSFYGTGGARMTDAALAFTPDGFAGFAVQAGGKLRPSIDFSGIDLAEVRVRVEALAPQFAALGRSTWHKGIMARLAELERRAA